MEPRTEEHQARPVVVGIDATAASRHALRWAAAQATLRGLPLRVVHAIDVAENYASGRRLVETAMLAARGLAPALAIRCATPMASARAALLDEARRAELLVVGRSGHARIALQVAKHAACPVVLVAEPTVAAR